MVLRNRHLGCLWLVGVGGPVAQFVFLFLLQTRQDSISDAYLTQIFIVPLIMFSLYSKQIYKLTSDFKHQHICSNYYVLVTFFHPTFTFAFLSTCSSSFLNQHRLALHQCIQLSCFVQYTTMKRNQKLRLSAVSRIIARLFLLDTNQNSYKHVLTPHTTYKFLTSHFSELFYLYKHLHAIVQ